MRFGTACTVLSAAATATTATAAVPSSSTTTTTTTPTRASTILDRQQRQLVSNRIISNNNDIGNVDTRKEKRLASLLSKHKQHYQQQQNQQEQNTGLLRNVERGTTEKTSRECDPTLTTTDENEVDVDVDVGILSCGLGRYCGPSSDSTLGGFCVNYSNDETSSSSSSSSTVATTDRNLQVLNDVIDFCQDVDTSATATGKSFGASGPITCDVCNVDVAEYTGQINCTYAESCYVLGGLCPEDTDMTRFCETTSVEANLTAVDEYVYKTCYNLHKPMNWTYCISYNAVPDEETTCEMEVDGTKCNSCTILGSNCRVFDCENTMVGKSSSACGYSLMEAYTSSYLYEQLPCEGGCSLCPDGEVMGSPDDSFVTSTGSISNCFVAQLSALTGDLTSRECSAESRRVANCDCGETPEPTEAPTSSSSTIGLLSVLATTSLMAFVGLAGGV